MTLLDDIQTYAQAENDSRLRELIGRRDVKKTVDRIGGDIVKLEGASVKADAIAAEENQKLNARQLELDQELEAARQEVRRLELHHQHESAVIRQKNLAVYQLAQEPQKRKGALEKELAEVCQTDPHQRSNFLERVQESAERRARENEKEAAIDKLASDYGSGLLEVLGLRRARS